MSARLLLSPRAKRGWAIGLLSFFIVLCAAIGFAQWWAYHVNVPAYERQMQRERGRH